jgi:asparagine N-glycosylation enzyme membrane subunit Stt3
MMEPVGSRTRGGQLEEAAMLWTILVILLVLWLLGVVTSYTLGGFIHVLLVVAVVLAIVQLLQGRRAL